MSEGHHQECGTIEGTQLTGCWLAFAAYLWLIAAVMAWRYYRGPWATMSLRQ